MTREPTTEPLDLNDVSTALTMGLSHWAAYMNAAHGRDNWPQDEQWRHKWSAEIAQKLWDATTEPSDPDKVADFYRNRVAVLRAELADAEAAWLAAVEELVQGKDKAE